MVEVSVYLITICAMFTGIGISSFIEDIIEYIKKSKWYAAVILVAVFVALYFICLEVFKCLII